MRTIHHAAFWHHDLINFKTCPRQSSTQKEKDSKKVPQWTEKHLIFHHVSGDLFSSIKLRLHAAFDNISRRCTKCIVMFRDWTRRRMSRTKLDAIRMMCLFILRQSSCWRSLKSLDLSRWRLAISLPSADRLLGSQFYDVFVSLAHETEFFFAFGSFRSIICTLWLPASGLVVAIYLPMGLFMFMLIIHQVSVQWVEGICKSMMGLCRFFFISSIVNWYKNWNDENFMRRWLQQRLV